ncbi:penicillin-binding protein [Clostridioides difficile]|uniref:transglycosylase domain-containing protein n=1 Tax=Clostridioides difficile TaxID=1496 RepID=UPI0010BA16E3|nr:transglycosylase domain-containing protein [Clostridioides difficile]VIC64574.1 penicillin-binding protein [Clostridioides difficile]
MNNDNDKNGNKIRRKKVSSSGNTNKPINRTSANKTRSTKNKKKSKKSDKFKKLRVFGIVFLVLLVVGTAGTAGLVFASLRDVTPVTEAVLDKQTNQTTTIKYANGKTLSTAPSVNKKTPVPLDKISPYLQHAVIAIEDERFYEHKGVDIKGLFRSVLKTLTGTKQGGSTIPMQVSKMLLTTEQQTIPRKIKDIYYAHEMSKTVSKDKILETYLNNFFVGRGLAGAEAGARGYFDKSAADLTLAESALLAGSTKNPSRFSAYKTSKLEGNETKEDLENKLLFFVNTTDDDLDDPTQVDFDMIEKIKSWELISNDTYRQLKAGTLVVRKAVSNPEAKKRQEIVLKKMLELKYIKQSEYDEAIKAKIEIKLPQSSDKVSSSVEDLIESEVINALMEQGHTNDEAQNLFYNGGLIVNTTIDPKMQDALEEEFDRNSNFPGHMVGPDGVSQPQAAMVILDYKNGEIRALAGGRNISGRKTLNRATNPHQPGSSIKPLAIYTPAIDTLKITQSTALSDSRGGYKFEENNKWNPRTTTAGHGSMSLRKALAKSSNTIAVKTAEMLGDSYDECVDIMMDYLKNFGITTLKNNHSGSSEASDRKFPSLTLGGMANGITPLQMAAAYGTLANQGVYVEPSIFTTITTFDGQLLVKNTPEEHKVVDPEVAYVVTDMLESVITEGTGGVTTLPKGMPVAGKTGTTNSAYDAWFVGYTPYYVGATYIGDDAGRKDDSGNTIKRREVPHGSTSTAKLWEKIMEKIHANLTVTEFEVPKNVYFTKINLEDGGKQSSGSKAAFIEGTAPTKVSSQPSSEDTKKPDNNQPEENNNNNNNTGDNGGGSTPPDNGGNNGGGSTTPPDNGGNNGGGSATPPDNGGNNGGGSTTPPDNGGNNGGGSTTPPDGGGTPAT